MMTRERVQIIGEMLRWVTPLLIAIVGYVSITYLSSIDRKFQNIDNKFDSFIISYHAMDMRITRMEDRSN